ncbi:MAG: PIN domain-containing protein [Burkholderiales bacterium]|nr:PIN domain-containing protein [Burkholderiales bacterium]
MNPTVYLETTVIGYLTSRPREDLIVAGHQQTTRDWWQTAGDRFELVASELVVQECSAGDQTAAEERLLALAGITLLQTTSDAEQLAEALIAGHAVPESNPEDALHIALAVVNGIQYLVSWNFRHIVNAAVRSTIERVCRNAGYEPPTICTPEELMESNDA